MNHTYIEENQVVDRYVMGKLPPDEAGRFEEHYLSCPECLDRLALAESLERGFKRAAGQDAARLAATRQLAVVAWLSRLSRSRQASALLLTFFCVLALPSLLAYRKIGELAATRATLEREREAAGSRTTAEAGKLRADLEASQRDLAREREARSRAAEQLAQATRPQENVPILFLNAERGPADGEPTFRLRLPKEPGWIVLAPVIDPPHYPSYRAVLKDARGREAWSGADLRLNEQESLSLSLPSTLLAPGDYTLSVEGLPPGRRPAPAGRFPFRVLPPA
jgi:anti-sigma factor RsiW